MNRKITHLVLFALVFFSVSTIGMQRRMPIPVWTTVFDLDSTVRSISNGAATPSSLPKEGRPIVVLIDNTAGTEYALIRSTDTEGNIPATITTSNAQMRVEAGAQLKLEQISADSAKPDARHWWVVGSGKIRVTGWDVVNNVTPH